MKQFNLQEYLAHPERKVVTRDGRPVRIICTDRKGLNVKPIVALITLPNCDEIVKCFGADGIDTAGSEDKNDLFFFPAKYERWINIYGNSIYYPGTKMYNTEQEAKEMRGTDAYVATVKIEWMEQL